MQRRGLIAAFFTMLMFAGTSGVAAAATVAPTPPPQCFVVKNGALPTCTQNPDGTWTAIYPKNGGNLDTGTSSGGRSATWYIELAVVIAAIIGIGVIVWWNWIRPRSRAASATPLPVVTMPPAVQPPATTPPTTEPPTAPDPNGGFFASRPDQPPPPQP